MKILLPLLLALCGVSFVAAAEPAPATPAATVLFKLWGNPAAEKPLGMIVPEMDSIFSSSAAGMEVA